MIVSTSSRFIFQEWEFCGLDRRFTEPHYCPVSDSLTGGN